MTPVILTHLNCPTPAHSGEFLGGDKIEDFLPKIKGAHSNMWLQDDGSHLCEGCAASILVEAQT